MVLQTPLAIQISVMNMAVMVNIAYIVALQILVALAVLDIQISVTKGKYLASTKKHHLPAPSVIRLVSVLAGAFAALKRCFSVIMDCSPKKNGSM
jgi:hypothetical protein